MVVAFQIPSADTNAKTSFLELPLLFPLSLSHTHTYTHSLHTHTFKQDPGAFLIEAR